MIDKREELGRLPFSTSEAIHLIEGLRNGLVMPFMNPEYQVLTYAIKLLKADCISIYELEVLSDEDVFGSLLTEKEINEALGYPLRPAPQASRMEIGSAIFVAKAQDTKTRKAISQATIEEER